MGDGPAVAESGAGVENRVANLEKPAMTDDPAVDAIEPWTIKACARRTRLKVVRLAQIEGVTVGQWLEKRVDEWEADGSPVAVPHVNGVANSVNAPLPELMHGIAAMMHGAAAMAAVTPLPTAVRRMISDCAKAAVPRLPALNGAAEPPAAERAGEGE
jgi:hypothetical protein